jgi:hypothetical protein
MRSRYLLAVAFTIAPGGIARAQQITTGAIQGTATDATGATLPGVTVEARHIDTNLVRTIVTESDAASCSSTCRPARIG